MKKPCCCGGSGTDENQSIKEVVRETYAKVADSAGGCGSCCGGKEKDPITRDLYSALEAGEVPEKALLASMGCANPLAVAELRPGEVVLDLGSGGGIDVLLSAKRVGPTGKAYGLDMTDEMLALARENQRQAGVENVEFLKGEIEDIPLPDNSVDVIISNCVINLSTDKDRVLKEAFRVLKPGGRFAVADIVLTRPLSVEYQRHLALWAGCVAGALLISEYKEKLAAAGFVDPEVEVVRTYTDVNTDGLIPEQVAKEIGGEGLRILKDSFVSALVRAVKP